ncbi:primosomal protein N' [Methylophaga lonarensis]|uniref:primosomal protein N' n=1 Tax=Methylophaga lonarensis TaxID=999151 RepID=UPI003D2DB827
MSSIVQVAVPCPLRQTFDYLSELDADSWQPGMRVKVSFSGRNVIGIVVSSKNNDSVDQKTLKNIEQRIDEQALIPQTLFDIIVWVSRYYHHPIGECFQAALPKQLRRADAAQLQYETYWRLAKNRQPEQRLGKKQQQIINLLEQHQNALSDSQIKKQLGSCKSSLEGLQKLELIQADQTAKMPLFNGNMQDHSQTLNSDQQSIVEIVWQHKDSFQPFLLHGVTGSGKTEVYIELTARMLEQGKQVLVLIPEIGLTGQFVERFYARLGSQIVVMHSSVSDSERKQAWLLARDGAAKVIIGTRSAIFTPLLNPGLVIIDEEHDSSYKQQDGLRYHARNIAMVRGRNHGIPVVLGSATPSLESLHLASQGRYQKLQLTERAGGAQLPKVELVSTEGLSESISPQMLQAIEKHLARGNQVLLFINRRGFAPILMCHECNWQAHCKHCDARMVVHQHRNILFCHHCGYIQRLPDECPDCGHKELKHYGAGTEKIEQSLARRFANYPVIRIDRDTTQAKNAFAEIVAEIQSGEPQILVGTQMLAKGHDFHNVTLVGIVDADHGLFSADFRATENLAQLVVQVTGRAGRGQKKGQVMIQTSQPDHEFWRHLLHQNYASVAEALLQERTQLMMPPSHYWVVIRSEAMIQNEAMQLLFDVLSVMQKYPSPEVILLGPVPALMEKKAGRYRAQLLLSCAQRKPLHQLLDQTLPEISKLKLARKCRWSVDVDPVALI